VAMMKMMVMMMMVMILLADVGHVLSFRGDLLHGGDPLLGGTRYIIAAFMLVHQGVEPVAVSCYDRVVAHALTKSFGKGLGPLPKGDDSASFCFDFQV
jgi:hypothetical protein